MRRRKAIQNIFRIISGFDYYHYNYLIILNSVIDDGTILSNSFFDAFF